MELSISVELAGFKDIDEDSMAVIKKKANNFVKDYSLADEHFKRLVVTLKKVHQREDHQVYELQAKLSGKEVLNTDVDDRNLLVAFDKMLKKLEAQAERRMHA